MRYIFPLLFLLLALPALCAAAPDAYEQAFQQRAKFVLEKRAQDDPVAIMEWANRVKLGDPHKYALGPIIARLALNPKDEKAIQAYRMLMEVDKGKGDRGLYHFALYGRTRLYFQFRDFLPKDVIDSNQYDVKHFFQIMRSGGTENHQFMSRANGYLWTEELPEPYPGAKQGDNKQWFVDWNTGQVRKFYTAGQGEYDSSTYVGFTAASYANMYDFAKDPNMCGLSRAALDWLAAAQALKYFHGCNAGPEARGFAPSAVNTITDWDNWLWFGDSARPITAEEPFDKVGKHTTVNLALSGYRPNAIIRNIATKNVPLPFAARNSKPSYYGDTPNKDQEYLYFNKQYSLTTLYSPEDGVRTVGTILPQTTMFKACLLDTNEVRTFGVANGYHGHFPVEGRTPYDQYHQAQDAALNVCWVRPQAAYGKLSDDYVKDLTARTQPRAILAVPVGIAEPVQQGGWYCWQVNKAYLAARPLNDQAAFADLPGVKAEGHRWLVSPGDLTGWAVQLGQQPDYPTLAAFQAAVLARCKLDTTGLADRQTATLTTLRGEILTLRHTGALGGRPDAWTNGAKLDYANWPVFDSPYVKEGAKSGVLELTDGRKWMKIDYTGAWPVYTEGAIAPAKRKNWWGRFWDRVF